MTFGPSADADGAMRIGVLAQASAARGHPAARAVGFQNRVKPAAEGGARSERLQGRAKR